MQLLRVGFQMADHTSCYMRLKQKGAFGVVWLLCPVHVNVLEAGQPVTPPCCPRTQALRPALLLDVTACCRSVAQTWRARHFVCAQTHLVYLSLTARRKHIDTHSRSTACKIATSRVIHVLHNVQGAVLDKWVQANQHAGVGPCQLLTCQSAPH